MAEKRVSVRLAATGGRQVRAELEGVGEAGKRGFGRLSAEMEAANRRLAGFARRVRVASAAAVAAATAAGVAMVRSGLQTVDAQAKLAQSLGTTVASIQTLERAGELAGVAMSGIEQATKDLTRRLSQAAAGTGPAADALDRLGLSATDLIALPLDQRVGAINAAIENFVPAAERAAISSQLFGNEARALGPLLTNLGLVEDTLGMVGDEAAYAGSSFAEFETRNSTFQANMQRLSNRLYELKVNIGNALLPAITQLGDAIAPVLTKLADLAGAYPEVTLAVVGATAAVIAFKGALAALRFAGLLGRGGVLSLIAAGYTTIGRAAIGARRAATNMIGLQASLAAMSGRPLGTLGRLGAGLKGIALAVPGVSAMASGVSAIGAAVATISAPVWGTFAVVAAAVAAAGIAIWRYWDRISAVFSGVGQAIGEALKPAMNWLGTSCRS